MNICSHQRIMCDVSLVCFYCVVGLCRAAPPNGRNVVPREMSTWVGQYEPLELFCLWTKVHQSFFSPKLNGIKGFWRGSGWSSFSHMFDMSIRSGDIRDQSRKLSKIAPKFGRFLALATFWGRAFQKLYARYHPCLAVRRLEKFPENTPTSP